MILAELKSYIAEHRGVSRRELAEHFRLSEDGVEAMLAVWLKKASYPAKKTPIQLTK